MCFSDDGPDTGPHPVSQDDLRAAFNSGNEWNIVMATAIMAMLPPAIVVIFMQRWFVKGLVDAEK